MGSAAGSGTMNLIAAVDALLPQTQCRRCGYDGCLPYAEALVTHQASTALCPPGGEATRQRLVQLLKRDDEAELLTPEPSRIAEIRESDCIGCRQCLDVCPVDAIIGAAGRMHTIYNAWCTGCELCVPVCPTDCITLPLRSDAAPSADDNRARHARRAARLDGRHELRRAPALVEVGSPAEDLRAAVLAAVTRKRGGA